jgi:hypothetical protein
LLLHTSCLNSNLQIKPWVLFIGDLREETILERQVLQVVLVMSSSYIEDLGKLMDKLITHIFFLVALELNIVDIEKQTRCNSCGTTDSHPLVESLPRSLNL